MFIDRIHAVRPRYNAKLDIPPAFLACLDSLVSFYFSPHPLYSANIDITANCAMSGTKPYIEI